MVSPGRCRVVGGGELAKPLDERRQAKGVGGDVVEEPVPLLRAHRVARLPQQFGRADDRGQRRFQFVGEMTRERLDVVGAVDQPSRHGEKALRERRDLARAVPAQPDDRRAVAFGDPPRAVGQFADRRGDRAQEDEADAGGDGDRPENDEADRQPFADDARLERAVEEKRDERQDDDDREHGEDDEAEARPPFLPWRRLAHPSAVQGPRRKPTPCTVSRALRQPSAASLARMLRIWLSMVRSETKILPS